MEGQHQRRFHDMKANVLSTLDMISTTCTLYIIYLIVTVRPSDLQYSRSLSFCFACRRFNFVACDCRRWSSLRRSGQQLSDSETDGPFRSPCMKPRNEADGTAGCDARGSMHNSQAASSNTARRTPTPAPRPYHSSGVDLDAKTTARVEGPLTKPWRGIYRH